MEQFPDGAHVRLRIRAHGGDFYLHAEEDGVGVLLHRDRGTLRVAWRVHRVQLHGGGAARVLLHSAAYGRYLALRPVTAPAPPPGLGARRLCRLVQCVYDDPEQEDVLWEAVDAGDESGGDVLMRHHMYGAWHGHADSTTLMRWVIEPIPPRSEPPALPLPAPTVGGSRTIRYVRADIYGNFSKLGWGTFEFNGQSVLHLREEVAIQLGELFFITDKTLCVRAGLCGRLTPLVIDLPRNQEPMDVIVLTTGSPAAEALVYPDVDA